MERKRKKTGNLLLFLAAVFPGVGACLFAQKPMVSLTINDKTVAPHESVTVTVTTNLNGSVKVDYPSEFSVDYGLMHGMEQKMDPSTGKIKTYYYMRQTGAFRKEGSYTFRAYVHYQGKEYASNKLTVEVSEGEEAEDENLGFNSRDPIFGVIQARKTTVYEGEPVLLKAKVFSRYDIYFLEAYKPFKADKNAEEYVFQNQHQNVEETKYNGKTVLTFDYGKQLLFPVATGKCRIQPFEMALRCHTTFFDKTITFKSSSATLTVKPLPNGAPKSFIGGVGTFTLSQETGNTKLKQGDVFTLTLVVEGLGNLHNINNPLLHLPKGCAVYGDPERKEAIQYTDEGVEGTITFLYNIQVMNSGTVAFGPQSIAYFDPEQEKYITVSTEGFKLEVTENPAFSQIADQTTDKPQHKDVGISQGIRPEGPDRKNDPLTMMVSIGTPVLLLGALAFLFISRRRKKTHQEELQMVPVEQPVRMAIPAAEEPDYWQLAADNREDCGQFAVALPKAIVQRLEQLLGEPGLSRERALRLLAEKNEDTALEIRRIIEICDQFRYGCSDSGIEPRDLLRRVEELL